MGQVTYTPYLEPACKSGVRWHPTWHPGKLSVRSVLLGAPDSCHLDERPPARCI